MVKVGNFQNGEQKHVMPLQARTQNSDTATSANMPSDRTIQNQAQCQWGERGNPLVWVTTGQIAITSATSMANTPRSLRGPLKQNTLTQPPGGLESSS